MTERPGAWLSWLCLLGIHDYRGQWEETRMAITGGSKPASYSAAKASCRRCGRPIVRKLMKG